MMSSTFKGQKGPHAEASWGFAAHTRNLSQSATRITNLSISFVFHLFLLFLFSVINFKYVTVGSGSDNKNN